MTNLELWAAIMTWTEGGFCDSGFMDKMAEKYPTMPEWLVGDIGVEHYRFLSYIVEHLGVEKVVDIGTYEGSSALALSANEDVHVISYDIMNRIKRLPKKSNITYKVENLLRTKNLPETRLIFLDVDPHDGIQEPMFMNLFAELEWKGIVIFDDIHLNGHMQTFWDNVEKTKYDLTKVGHHSGTGMVLYD